MMAGAKKHATDVVYEDPSDDDLYDSDDDDYSSSSDYEEEERKSKKPVKTKRVRSALAQQLEEVHAKVAAGVPPPSSFRCPACGMMNVNLDIHACEDQSSILKSKASVLSPESHDVALDALVKSAAASGESDALPAWMKNVTDGMDKSAKTLREFTANVDAAFAASRNASSSSDRSSSNQTKSKAKFAASNNESGDRAVSKQNTSMAKFASNVNAAFAASRNESEVLRSEKRNDGSFKKSEKKKKKFDEDAMKKKMDDRRRMVLMDDDDAARRRKAKSIRQFASQLAAKEPIPPAAATPDADLKSGCDLLTSGKPKSAFQKEVWSAVKNKTDLRWTTHQNGIQIIVEGAKLGSFYIIQAGAVSTALNVVPVANTELLRIGDDGKKRTVVYNDANIAAFQAQGGAPRNTASFVAELTEIADMIAKN